MSTNPFKGIGAINLSPTYAAASYPKMTSLGKQYMDNVKGVWPNSNQSLLLVMAHAGPPYVTQYYLNKDGSIFERSANNISISITGTPNGVEFSRDGTYIAFAHTTTPFITIAKRSTTDTSRYEQLSTPASLPPTGTQAATWSPDATYLAFSHSTSPYISIYKRSGDTFTKLAAPASLAGGTAWGAKFSPDGVYLAMAYGTTSPFCLVYKRSGDTFTKLADPGTPLPSTPNAVDWSPDGNYLAFAHGTTPFVTIYKRSGDTFTKITNPSTLPTGTGYGIRFSPIWPSGNGYYMAVTHSTTPFCSLYRVDPSTDAFSYSSITGAGGSIPLNTAQCAVFTEDCSQLYIGYAGTSPFWTQVGLGNPNATPSYSTYVYNDLKDPLGSVYGIDILYST